MRIFTKMLMTIAIAMPVMAQAQITTKVVELKSIKVDGEDFPVECTWFRVSDNGKYGVGCDLNYIHAGFMFDAETEQFSLLNEPSSDNTEAAVIAKDVADDGTIAGAMIAEGVVEGNVRKVWVPALRKPDGEWVKLPLPESVVTKYDYRYPEYANFAKLISPDGTVVCGEVFYKYGEKENVLHPGQITILTKNAPIIWRNVNGEWKYEEFDYTQVESNVFVPYDMSNDGKTIVGMAESARGDQLTAYSINGKLEYLHAPVLKEVVYYDEDGVELEPVLREVDENGEVIEDAYFWEAGTISWLDDDMNAYYQYLDGYNELHSGVKNLTSGEEKELSSMVSCGTNGWWLGQKHVIQGTEVDLSKFYSPLSVSDNGKLIGGVGYSVDYEMGAEWNHPMVMLLSESPFSGTDNIGEVAAGTGKVVNTVYYDLQGRQVTKPATGIYVKVDTMADGTTRSSKCAIR